MIAFGLKGLFEAEGANAHIAPSPDDALSLADDLVISAAVVDFGSSADDNGRLCRTLRAYGIPFMYYTGYDDVEEGRWGAPSNYQTCQRPSIDRNTCAASCGAGHQSLKQYGNRSPRRALSNLRRSKANCRCPYR